MVWEAIIIGSTLYVMVRDNLEVVFRIDLP